MQSFNQSALCRQVTTDWYHQFYLSTIPIDICQEGFLGFLGFLLGGAFVGFLGLMGFLGFLGFLGM